jgi:hypothetical protein
MTTTASIYINKIDAGYPQAGKNNDSQGFRDNFANIKNALSSSNSDIEYLQENAVQLDQENDFGYNIAKKITLQSPATKLYDDTINTRNGQVNVDFRDGAYQKFKVDGNTTFQITNWPQIEQQGQLPVPVYASIVLSVTPTTSTSLTLSVSSAKNASDGVTDFTPITSTSTGVKFLEIWTDDTGQTVYAMRKGV